MPVDQLAVVAVWMCLLAPPAEDSPGPHFATGIKIGEVTDQSAIIWTRLTDRPERNPSDGPKVTIEYEKSPLSLGKRTRTVKGVVYPDGVTTGDLREAVPGADGDVRVFWKKEGDQKEQKTPWRRVDSLGDFTRAFKLEGLTPGTNYEVRIVSRGIAGKRGDTITGTFHTAPTAETVAPINFVVATCFGNDDQDSADGFLIHDQMRKLNPDFFVHTGDIFYYDELAKTVDLARYHWQRMFSWPSSIAFHQSVPSYFMKDDHDTWCNDCWPTMQSPHMHEFTFRQGQQIYREQVPMGPLTYRTFRWGKDVQIWLMEGRDFRSSNLAPDGPKKTIWGAKQKQWLKDSVRESDAAFRILISPTPIVGPDRSTKNDNHANHGFTHEGDEIRQFLAEQKNMIVVCGDRHWQYMSVDPKTGLQEFSCGPASDKHAGGWKQEDYVEAYHRYLRVKGGFLLITAERQQDTPTLTARYYDVDGNIAFEHRAF